MTNPRDDVPPFALRLRELRRKAGLSQQALADAAGLHLGGIFKLEQGVNAPSWATVEALAKALGVDCTAFRGTSACEGCPKRKPAPKKRGNK